MERVLLQIIMVVIGSVGFAIYFNIDKSKITSVAIGGLISWLLYLICFEKTKNIFIATFISALITNIYSETMARILKSPANIFLISSIIPLLPGGSFYYTMYGAVSMNMELFKVKGLETFTVVLAIACGIIIGFFIFKQVFDKIKN